MKCLKPTSRRRTTVNYDLKHELIAAQIRLEEAAKEIERLKDENNELQKQIVKLEARIPENNGRR